VLRKDETPGIVETSYVRFVKRRGRNLIKDRKTDEIRASWPLFIDEQTNLR